MSNATAHPCPPCKDGHTFYFASDNSLDMCAEGTVCECGETEAHWEPCPTCGHLVCKAVARKEAK